MLCIILGTISISACAQEQLLLEVENGIEDEKEYVTRFYLKLNSQKHIIGIEQRKYLVLTDELLVTKKHSMEHLPQGLVLEQRESLNVITLDSQDFDPAHGGRLRVSFLKNGITGSFEEINLRLVKDQGTWLLIDDSEQVIQKYFLHPNWILFLGIIGIEKMEAIHPKLECSEMVAPHC